MKFQIKSDGSQPCAVCTFGAYYIAAILLVSAGPAWSFDTYHGITAGSVHEKLAQGNRSPMAKTPSPSMVDMCLPLLNSIHHIPSNSSMEWNQRSAGEAAAFGFMFGIRFALAPSKKPSSNNRSKTSARFDVWHQEGEYAGNRQALAVAAYRQCQKQQAFYALSEFRWKR